MLKKNSYFKKSFKNLLSKKKVKTIFKENYIADRYFQLTQDILLKATYTIVIKITPNNIFCTLKKTNTNKTLLVFSAGMLKINVSKKKLKFVSKIIITKFTKNLKSIINEKTLIIDISGPKKTKKTVLELLIMNLNENKLIINFKEKKCFNGCREKKQRRKKRKGLRVFK
jgi:ribosomal protein S11